jgi:hypothetical protein
MTHHPVTPWSQTTGGNRIAFDSDSLGQNRPESGGSFPPRPYVPLSLIGGPLLVKIGRMRDLAVVLYCLNKDRSMASAIALYPASFGWR